MHSIWAVSAAGAALSANSGEGRLPAASRAINRIAASRPAIGDAQRLMQFGRSLDQAKPCWVLACALVTRVANTRSANYFDAAGKSVTRFRLLNRAFLL